MSVFAAASRQSTRFIGASNINPVDSGELSAIFFLWEVRVMIDLAKARQAFRDYISAYRAEDDKINLKISHTYRVVSLSERIAAELSLTAEDQQLASLIGLLHDIGRFEQLRRFGTFVDADSIDHAKFGCELLFGEGLIRRFLEDSVYDPIIEAAISEHSAFAVRGDLNEQQLLHAKIIRDSDKLDNFHVKLVETVSTLFDVPDIGGEELSDLVYQKALRWEPIRHADAVTHIDQWVKYLAFLYDLNFDCSLRIVREHDYIRRNVERICYTNPETAEKMQQIALAAENYVKSRLKK